MSDEVNEAASLKRMAALLRDIEDYSASGEDFSVVDLVDSMEIPDRDDKLLSDLVRHHFQLLKEKRPDLSVEQYEAMFPQHADWSQWLDSEFPDELLSQDAASGEFRGEDSIDRLLEEELGLLDCEAEELEGVAEFQCGPLEDLAPTMQEILLAKMDRVTFEPGQKIISEGETGDSLYVCISGSASVTISQGKSETFDLGKIFPGHVFGEMALMGIARRTATVIADGKVEALSLNKENFDELRQKHQAFAHVITAIIADRLGRRSLDALSTVTLEGYKIARRLGRGGMAVVYDAEQIATGERVALKMMSHRLAFDEHAKEWFQREAEIISKFDHPNIPKLVGRFDAFATSFIAMEFLPGISLAEVIKICGTLSEENVLRILSQIADALVYAHAQGIMHRDVKPSNVMLDSHGHVKLMDFGLSLPRYQEDDTESAAFGTPAYIAPEQVTGKICAEGDWFSLGLIGYELATGEKLFAPRTLLQMKKQFSNWDPQDAANDLPEDDATLRRITQCLLAIHPPDRTDCLAELTEYFQPVDVSTLKCWS